MSRVEPNRESLRVVAENRQRRRYEELVEHYRLKILEGEFREGDSLPSEREMSEQFGVGRSSVREAMFTLSRLGLLRLQSGARARVARFSPQAIVRELTNVTKLMLRSPEAIKEMQHTRMIVESGLAREAARKASDAAIEDIRQALQANYDAIGNQELFMRSDVAFHFAIASAVGNRILVAALQGLADWLYDQRRVTMLNGALQTENYEQHRDIFRAIEARDCVRAHTLMEEHIIEVGRKYWRTLTDEPSAAAAALPISVPSLAGKPNRAKQKRA